jgi:hypothetical protein
MAKLSSPSIFVLLQQRRRRQQHYHRLFFFFFCYSAMLLSPIFCYSIEGDGLLFSFYCNKEGDGNNVVVAFFFLFCCSTTKKATTVKLLSPFFLS